MFTGDAGESRCGSRMWLVRTGLVLGLLALLAVPAAAQESQFLAFPGEYASRGTPFAPIRPSAGGVTTYSYTPSYSRPVATPGPGTRASAPAPAPTSSSAVVPSPGWVSPSYGGRYPTWRSGGGAYDAGLFSRWPLGGGAYDSGLFSSWRSGGGAYDGGLFFGR
jgi:hypothetical protein